MSLKDLSDEDDLIALHWKSTQRPLVAGKLALTLDGKFAAASGSSKWVTGESAREDVMRWRQYFPSIAVGAGTVLRDDPSLTSRIGGDVHCPLRLVFDRSLKSIKQFKHAKLYTDEFRQKTVLVCLKSAEPTLKDQARELGCQIWEFEADASGYPEWSLLLEQCASSGIKGIYVEAGPRLATAFVESGRFDYIFTYTAPKFMSDSEAVGVGSARATSSMGQALGLTDVRHEVFGEDILTRGFLNRNNANGL